MGQDEHGSSADNMREARDLDQARRAQARKTTHLRLSTGATYSSAAALVIFATQSRVRHMPGGRADRSAQEAAGGRAWDTQGTLTCRLGWPAPAGMGQAPSRSDPARRCAQSMPRRDAPQVWFRSALLQERLSSEYNSERQAPSYSCLLQSFWSSFAKFFGTPKP